MKLNDLMKNYPKLSLKRICDETKMCYQYVLKTSKLPIEGKPYDITEFNYEAVEKIIERKGINLDDYNWDEINESVKTVVPVNKSMDDFTVGTKFTLRNDTTVYEVVYTTVTHIVFIAIDPETTQPRTLNYETFVHQSPRILQNKEDS